MAPNFKGCRADGDRGILKTCFLQIIKAKDWKAKVGYFSSHTCPSVEANPERTLPFRSE